MKRRILIPVLALAAAGVVSSGLAQEPSIQTRVVRKVAGPEQTIVVTADAAGNTQEQRNVVFARSSAIHGEDVSGFAFGQAGAMTTSVFRFDGNPVVGKPYSADIVKESIQTLADGNRIVRKSTGSVARDGQGRIRQEDPAIAFGPLADATATLPKLVTIFDPVAGTTFTLNSSDKTAFKMPTFNFSGKGAKSEGGKVVTFTTTSSSQAGGAPLIINSTGGAPLREKVIRQVQPSYPGAAKASGAQGPVQVTMVVNENGDVVSAEAVNGNPLLREAAVEAGKQWKFQETVVDGKPVKVRGTVTFNFSLAGSKSEPGQGEKTITLTAPSVAEGGPHILSVAGNSKYETRNEPLGTQVIEGVSCEGTRSTTTIPAGEIGNELPINIVSETWFSKELETTVLRTFKDPRVGEDNFRLTNIQRTEPAKELFEIPSDYTTKEGPGGNFIMKKIGEGQSDVQMEFKKMEKTRKDN